MCRVYGKYILFQHISELYCYIVASFDTKLKELGYHVHLTGEMYLVRYWPGANLILNTYDRYVF